jgi:hypothetical protein
MKKGKHKCWNSECWNAEIKIMLKALIASLEKRLGPLTPGILGSFFSSALAP